MDLHPPPVDVQRTMASDDDMVALANLWTPFVTLSVGGFPELTPQLRTRLVRLDSYIFHIKIALHHGGNKAPLVRPAGGQEEA